MLYKLNLNLQLDWKLHILSHALQIKPDFAIGLEVTYQSYSVLEMLSKKDNKHKGGQFRLLSFNNII